MCTLNNYRAPVAWFKEKTKLSEENEQFSIDKDIIGSCKLTIKNPTKADAGKYSCKIVGREKEKNCLTKTEVIIKGRSCNYCMSKKERGHDQNTPQFQFWFSHFFNYLCFGIRHCMDSF